MLTAGLATHSATAAMITFNGSAPAGSVTDYGANGSYIEQGFTLTATGYTRLISTSSTAIPPFVSAYNATDYIAFQNGANSLTLASATATPFSLQRFDATRLYFAPMDLLTLTGNLVGGGSLEQTFILTGNQWSPFTLNSSWINLSSVNIVASQGFIGLDNIAVAQVQSPVVPIPTTVWSFMAGLASLYGLSKRPKAANA